MRTKDNSTVDWIDEETEDLTQIKLRKLFDYNAKTGQLINKKSGKRAGAYLSRLSSQDLLYATQNDGVVTEKTVSAQQGTSVSKKYAAGQEKGKHADMQRVESLLKPYLCSGVGSINGWVCK